MSVPPAEPRLQEAFARLAAGDPVLVYDADGREEEVDLFYAGAHATPEAVRTLRRDAGGLVFLAVAPEFGKAFGLPFLHDMYQEDAKRHPVLARMIPDDIRYDTRSSFSLTINHRETFTGITDNDRSLTIREFTRTCEEGVDLDLDAAQTLIGSRFRTPGHVHLCVGAHGGLAERQGHTELAVTFARLAGVTPVLAGCEMLAADGSGKALSLKDAEAWAAERGTVVIEGREILEAWKKLNDGRSVPAAKSA